MVLEEKATLEARSQILATVREFVQRDVLPVVSKMEHDDERPVELLEKMREMGLFGMNIPEEYGGLGLDYTTFAMIFEELAKGWMGALCGPLGTHHILAYTIANFGSDEQKKRFLPRMARGELRGGLALTEPNAGSDVQSIQTRAVRQGDHYVLNGSKLFITNGRNGNVFALLAVTNPKAEPRHRGLSCFVAEKGPGFTVGRDLDKLGYKGVDTCELIFQDYRVPAANVVGGEEGKGFGQVMSGLESGRINIAARAVGIATAAFEAAIKYAQQRNTFGVPIAQHQAIQLMLAEMGTKIQAARLMTYDAARKKDSGERADMEAAMAKYFSSEVCQQVTLDAMRIHGGYGYIKEYPLERYYRDAPLMIIGEGTNEIQRVLIARQLLQRYKI
ncbi:MAG: acyl-CoA dehydrogenase family protein [Chloroflexi bacterium]|nr:acyl-CoA dehydrogenase family protein [Chloroflexota bacterium]